MPASVYLDTSFLIRLFTPSDKLHKNVLAYIKYFLDNDHILKCSTIALAEYCVKGKLQDLPFQYLQISPYNIDAVETTGSFANYIFSIKDTLNFPDRKIIPNDTKLFAQAFIDPDTKYFITCDTESIKIFSHLKSQFKINYELIDFNIPPDQYFVYLELIEE
jgi:hypothetical protein